MRITHLVNSSSTSSVSPPSHSPRRRRRTLHHTLPRRASVCRDSRCCGRSKHSRRIGENLAATSKASWVSRSSRDGESSSVYTYVRRLTFLSVSVLIFLNEDRVIGDTDDARRPECLLPSSRRVWLRRGDGEAELLIKEDNLFPLALDLVAVHPLCGKTLAMTGRDSNCRGVCSMEKDEFAEVS